MLRVDEDNLKARKSYEKAGFVCEGIMRNDRLRQGKFIHRYRYSMLKEEYQSLFNSLIKILCKLKGDGEMIRLLTKEDAEQCAMFVARFPSPEKRVRISSRRRRSISRIISRCLAQHDFKPGQWPLLQGFWKESMVRIGQGSFREFPSFLPAEMRFIEQNSH